MENDKSIVKLEQGLIKLEQEFKDYKAVKDKEIFDLEQEFKDHEKRIKEIETSKQKTDFQYEQIMGALKKINDETIPSLIKEIEELKNKPVKRYDTIVTSIITGIVGAFVGAFASLFFNK